MFKRKPSGEKKDTCTEEVARIIKILSTEDKEQFWDIHHASKDIFNAFSRDGLVVFGFTISLGGGRIILWNYHREAETGNGTKALTSLETMLGKLANIEKTEVVIIFDTFGQEDTKRWLIKNHYTEVSLGKFQKTICPVKK